MWMGCIKLSLLGTEHLSTALIVLRNSLKLSHITKRDFLQLNCLPLDQYIWYRCCRSNLNRIETSFPSSFWKSNLKWDFFHIYLTTFFACRNLRNKSARASSFFWKWSKYNLDFENARKNSEKVFRFWDNCIRLGCIILPLLGREHWSTALIVLTNSHKLLHITKRDFLKLHCLSVDQKYGTGFVAQI